MFNILPAKRSGRWLLWMAVYGFVLLLLLWLNRFVVLGNTLETYIALRFAILALFLSVVVNGFGWLGARWVWLFTTLGITIGLALMFYYVFRDMAGWQDLVSFIGFVESVVIGFALGLLVEGIRIVLKMRRNGSHT